jgi:hypothetical protein
MRTEGPSIITIVTDPPAPIVPILMQNKMDLGLIPAQSRGSEDTSILCPCTLTRTPGLCPCHTLSVSGTRWCAFFWGKFKVDTF